MDNEKYIIMYFNTHFLMFLNKIKYESKKKEKIGKCNLYEINKMSHYII